MIENSNSIISGKSSKITYTDTYYKKINNFSKKTKNPASFFWRDGGCVLIVNQLFVADDNLLVDDLTIVACASDNIDAIA